MHEALELFNFQTNSITTIQLIKDVTLLENCNLIVLHEMSEKFFSCNTSLSEFMQGSTRSRNNIGEPLATSYHSKFMGTVDYIWYSYFL